MMKKRKQEIETDKEVEGRCPLYTPKAAARSSLHSHLRTERTYPEKLLPLGLLGELGVSCLCSRAFHFAFSRIAGRAGNCDRRCVQVEVGTSGGGKSEAHLAGSCLAHAIWACRNQLESMANQHHSAALGLCKGPSSSLSCLFHFVRPLTPPCSKRNKFDTSSSPDCTFALCTCLLHLHLNGNGTPVTATLLAPWRLPATTVSFREQAPERKEQFKIPAALSQSLLLPAMSLSYRSRVYTVYTTAAKYADECLANIWVLWVALSSIEVPSVLFFFRPVSTM